MKSTINISVEHEDGIIKELDKTKFFQLSKDSTSRIDLFNFALGLGLKEGYPTKLSSSKGLTRTSYDDVHAYFYIYKSIYYSKVIVEKELEIDAITDIDAALELVEEYANTGFTVLSKMKEEYSDSVLFMKKLLTLIDDMALENAAVFNVKKMYIE